MRNALILARFTLMQLRRERLLWSGLVVALLLAAFGLALAPLSLQQNQRIILDLGLAAASVTGTVLALAATVRLVGAELHEQHAHTLLARRIHRHTYLAGRTLGLGAAVAIVVGSIGATTALLCSIAAGAPPAAFWPALLLTVVEAVVVVCVTLVFATWTTPFLAATFTAGIIVAGHMSGELLTLAPGGQAAAGWHLAYWLVPDMQRLSLRDHVANLQAVDVTTLALQLGYGVSYAAAALLMAMFILARRRCI